MSREDTQTSSFLRSVNLIVSTLLLVHLILCISPHHSHHLHSHHLSLPQPFILDIKLHIPSSIVFLIPSGLPLCILNLYELSLHWRFFVLAASLVIFFLAKCARLSWSHSAFESTLLFYRSVSFHVVCPFTPQLSLVLLNQPRRGGTLSWHWYTVAAGDLNLQSRDHKSDTLPHGNLCTMCVCVHK